MVDIDFGNCYEMENISPDLRESSFITELEDSNFIPLRVQISNEAHELLPHVYNMAFGPLNRKGQIDDRVQLSHKNYSKVFSTILLNALTYLTGNKTHYLGIDGSDNGRALLYYRFLQRNYDYLDQYFNMFGLKYYVRITRFGKTQYDNPFDFDDITPYPIKIQKGSIVNRDKMYNYFIFNLK